MWGSLNNYENRIYNRFQDPEDSACRLAEQIEQLLGLSVELVSLRAIKPNKLKYIVRELIYI
jgi:predicted nucleotidyltransferase